MLRRIFWLALAVGFYLAPNAVAQDCSSPADSGKVGCTLANTYGQGGLSNGAALAPTPNGHQGHFANSFLSNLKALNSSIGSELGELPQVSPSSGIAFTFNPSLGVVAPSEYNFGPILSEPASTLGKHRLLVGFTFQDFDFTSLDGIKLNNLPAVYTHEDYAGCTVNGGVASPTLNEGACGFVRDTIVTQDNINFRLNQYTAFVNFGLTDRLDISVAVPSANVRMAVTSTAQIHNNGLDNLHQFTGCSCFNGTFLNVTGASGIGDVTLRGKYEVFKGERTGIAVGGDIRFPSGDALNYLGAGAYGIRPFGALSHNFGNRASAHINLGYEWNGRSYLAGDITPAPGTAPSKALLPQQFFYSIGAEFGVYRKLSAAVDYLGQYFWSAPLIAASTYQELPGCLTSACTTFNAAGAVDANFRSYAGSYTTAKTAVGFRYRVFNEFVVTANVLIQLNDTGLRSHFVPLFGLSYSH
jgi:outer membrane putative beta-barrel porin/alpha-amylase